jgi:hypothetical protein
VEPEGNGTWFAEDGGMSRQATVEDLTVDFLVPACLASRYRARLVAVSASEAELQLSFCPSMFRSGDLTACPAEISLVVGACVVRRRGLFEIEGANGNRATIGHFAFEEPVDGGDLELLRSACHVAKPAAEPEVSEEHREVLPGILAQDDGGLPLWLRPSDN